MPEEGDDLEEFEESDECQWFDDRVGGVAQAICTVHARVQCGDCSQVLSMAVVCCSLAFQIQLKCGCDAMLDLSPSSHEISQLPDIPCVLAFRLHVTCIILHLLLDRPRHLHSTCCPRPIPRMIQRCRHCAVRHLVDEDGASSVCSVAS